MNLSPGPTPWCPSTTSSAASASASSRSTRRCIRSVSESRGRCTPGQVDEHHLPTRGRVRRDAANRPAGGLRAIGDDRHLGADDRVDQRRLADVGATRRARRTQRGSSVSPLVAGCSAAGSRALDHGGLQLEHLARRPPRGRIRTGGGRRAPSPRSRSAACSGQMTTSPSSRGPATRSAPSIGNESTSVGSSRPRCSRFSSRIRPGGHQLDREVPLDDAGRAQGDRGRRSQLHRDVREVHGHRVNPRCGSPARTRRRRRRCSARADGGRRPRRRTARRRCRRPAPGSPRSPPAPSAGRAAGRSG